MTRTEKVQVLDRSTRGVALIYTMLILTLLTVLSLGMVIALSSQTFIGGYYRNFRGAFYAADSGINIARQAMVNEVISLVPASITIGTAPLSAASATTVQTYVNNTYNAWGSIAAGQAANSWPGQFELNSAVPATFTFANCHLSYTPVGAPPAGGPYTCSSLPPATSTCSTAAGILTNCYTINNFQYTFNYSVDVYGQVKGNEQSELADNGNVQVTVNISPPSGVTTTPSFAAWGMFIDQYSLCSGSYLVPGTISGPVFTNGGWTFGTSGNYIFTDSVGSHNADAGYQFSSPCNEVAGPSDSYSGTTIAPTFQNGFNLGQPSVPLPPNSYNQEEAVLDGVGNGTFLALSSNSTVLHAQFNSILKDANGVAYPTGSSATNGVYLPYYNNGGVPTLGSAAGTIPGTLTPSCGGGILIEGSATVTVTPLAGSSTAQVYTIVQGGTTTTVTVNPTTNTTSIKKGGGATTNITGVPQNCSPGVASSPATMLYVDGSITGLSGAGQGVGDIQNGTELTITAASDITITGDLLYKTEPVTTTQNQIPGTPADTLIPGNNYNQVLGIFTAGGNINLQNSQGNGNLEIDASVATIAAGGSGGLVNTGSAINTLNIIGGRIQNTIQNINTTTRNVFFDRRFAQGGFAPPWFPSTTVTTTPSGVEASTASAPTVTRVQWVCKSCT